MASLNQAQFVPWPVQDQVVILFAATQGYCDDVPVPDISRFETELRNFVNQQHPEIGQSIAATKDLTADNEAALRAAIDVFRDSWFADRGES